MIDFERCENGDLICIKNTFDKNFEIFGEFFVLQ